LYVREKVEQKPTEQTINPMDQVKKVKVVIFLSWYSSYESHLLRIFPSLCPTLRSNETWSVEDKEFRQGSRRKRGSRREYE
jgi:hypothetical protein